MRFLKIRTTSQVTPEDRTLSKIDSEDERFDISDSVIKNPPSKIQKNHPIGNIIDKIDEGNMTRDEIRSN